MSYLYVEEFSILPVLDSGESAQMPRQPSLTTQKVDFSGGVAASSAFNRETTYIGINTDATCSYQIGTNPTATVSTMRLPANGTMFFAVPKGQSHKISVIANT